MGMDVGWVGVVVGLLSKCRIERGLERVYEGMVGLRKVVLIGQNFARMHLSFDIIRPGSDLSLGVVAQAGM